MKKLIIILSLMPILLISQLQLAPEVIRTSQYSTLLSKDNKVILHGRQITNQLSTYSTIDYFDGNSWAEIPTVYNTSDKDEYLYFFNDESNITFGSNDELWLCGSTDGFYKWNGNELEKYYLDDNYKSIREYNSIALDSMGNIWLTTKVILSDDPPFTNYFSEIIKYDGKNYNIVSHSKGQQGHLGYGKIFVTSENLILITALLVNNNLILISDDNNIEEKTIPTPHHAYDPLRFEQRFAKVVNIFEDSDSNIWFSMSYNDPRDPGIVILKNDGSWDVLTEHNNYPLRSSTKGFPSRDSLFKECFAVTEDPNGKIWIGGVGFLNYIDESNMLVTPDVSEFLHRSTFYSRTIITDPDKEAPPEKVKFLNSSDSIMALVTELFERDLTTKHTIGKSSYSGSTVEGMTTTEDGSLWIFIEGLGVLRYQPSITNVEDVRITEAISLYPQPASSKDRQINIAFDEDLYVTKVNVYNLSGQKLLSNNYDTQIEDKIQLRFDNNFVAGIYLAAIELKNKTIFKKFVIN